MGWYFKGLFSEVFKMLNRGQKTTQKLSKNSCKKCGVFEL